MLAILLCPVNRLLEREAGLFFILIYIFLTFLNFLFLFIYFIFYSCPPPSTVRPLLAGRIFVSVLAGACKFGTEWAGLRLIHHHHRQSFFCCWHTYFGTSPFCARPAEPNTSVRDAQPPSGVSRPQTPRFAYARSTAFAKEPGRGSWKYSPFWFSQRTGFSSEKKPVFVCFVIFPPR